MLKIHKFIQENSLETLVEKYSLIRKDLDNLVILQYHQLDTPKNELTDECRALILDKSNNFKVVCKSFTRFNDYSPNIKTDFDFNDFYVTPKIDGSLINMWWYDEKWNISTKSEIQNHFPFPEKINDQEHSLNSLFWEIFNQKYELPTDITKTYIFEFKHPHGNYLTQSPDYSITLIGCSDLNTLQEIDIYELNNNWDKITKFRANFEEILEKCTILDPIKDEGFVIIDSKFKRLKVKSPQYDAIGLIGKHYENETEVRKNKVNENNKRRILDIIRWNEIDTFLSLYPELSDIYKNYRKIYVDKVAQVKQILIDIKELDKKEKGLFLAKNDLKHLNGLVFGNYKSVESYLRSISLNSFIDFMNK